VIEAEVISSVKQFRIENVISLINKHQKGRNVYVVGCTNVGKSTFINSLIKHFTGEENVITTSIFPGTTISTIEIEMNGGYLIDTPGVINKHQVVHYLDQSLKDVLPYKGIKPTVYQVLGGQTFFMGGFARVDYPEGDLASLVFYNANKLPIRRTKTEKADQYYITNRNTLLSPPVETEKQKLGEFKSHKISLKSDQDLVISGLGFMTMTVDAQLVLHLPTNLKYFIRESIF
jgi:ribosome biogenesis GTPase A